MKACVRILFGLALWNMLISASWAQLTDPQYINLPEKGWIVKYDNEQHGQPNKNGDKAIQVFIGISGVSQDLVVKLFRYSRVNQGVYILRQNGGNLELPVVLPLNAGFSKRKRFTTEWTEYQSNGKTRQVLVKGWWHPGPGRNRDDHRLSIRIIDREKMDVSADSKDEDPDKSSDPCCEQEPDTDILAEVPLIIDPVTQLPPPPTYP